MSTLTVATISDGTNSTSSTNPIRGSARAWVNFNGTGTVAIRASYNVSSITDNGTGQYTINFTNPFADTNYCGTAALGGPVSNDATTVRVPDDTYSMATGSCPIGVARPTVAYFDVNTVCVSFFR